MDGKLILEMSEPVQSLQVFLLHPFDPPIDAYLSAQLDANIEIIEGPDIPKSPEYNILVAGRPKREHLEASPNLRILVIPWAGIPEETSQIISDFPHLGVHNLHHNAVVVAESALGLLLAVAQQILPFDQSLRKHDWSPRYESHTSIQLSGKTVLIMGYGQIGQRLGIVLEALGMYVSGLRRDPLKPLILGAPRNVYDLDRLDYLLTQAQVLIVTLPLTETTHGLLGEKELGLLPKGALLVNVGRGAVIDQQALYKALVSGHLAGAGLDVWYCYLHQTKNRQYTPPSDYPFHELNNVVLSPHRAGLVKETEKLRAEALAELINAVGRGNATMNAVDVKAGY